MRPSLKLLTAGLLVGGLLSPRFAAAQTTAPAAQQSPTPQSAAQQPAPPQQYPAAPATDLSPPPPRSLSFGERLRNFFSPKPPEPRVQQAADVQPSLGPRTIGVQAATASRTVVAPAPKGPSDLTEKELQKVGHEQDYSWITGKLVREGNRWVLRYAGPYEVDRFGGSVALSAHPELANYRSGELVCVHGKVGTSGRAGSNAVYQLDSISRIAPAGR